MSAARTLSFALLFVVGLCTAQAASAYDGHGDYDRLDRLATRLEAESRTLYYELRYDAVTPELRVALAEVASIHRQARHIHDGIHAGYGLHHLHTDVAQLTTYIHHVEEHLAAYHHFDRHVRRMDSLIHQMDDCLHDLADSHVVARPTYVPVYRGPSGGGISFGGSGFSIRLGR